MSVLEPSQLTMWKETDQNYFRADKATVTGCAQTHGPWNLSRSSLETHLVRARPEGLAAVSS